VIFDAVRPLITHDQIEHIKKAVIKHPSISFGLEPADTIYFNGTYQRKGLIALQVPQAFDLKKLREAHAKTKLENATDDTIIMHECFGICPEILNGGANLLKITRQSDLQIIESLCKN
jgi:2-C-methyl-D-erythritol 4-phosphate cytidylyltransferase